MLFLLIPEEVQSNMYSHLKYLITLGYRQSLSSYKFPIKANSFQSFCVVLLDSGIRPIKKTPNYLCQIVKIRVNLSRFNISARALISF